MSFKKLPGKTLTKSAKDLLKIRSKIKKLQEEEKILCQLLKAQLEYGQYDFGDKKMYLDLMQTTRLTLDTEKLEKKLGSLDKFKSVQLVEVLSFKESA